MPVQFYQFAEWMGGISIGILTPDIIAIFVSIVLCIGLTRERNEFQQLYFPMLFAAQMWGFYTHPIAMVIAGFTWVMSVVGLDAVYTQYFNTFSSKKGAE